MNHDAHAAAIQVEQSLSLLDVLGAIHDFCVRCSVNVLPIHFFSLLDKKSQLTLKHECRDFMSPEGGLS
jgi:hypothetical protein